MQQISNPTPRQPTASLLSVGPLSRLSRLIVLLQTVTLGAICFAEQNQPSTADLPLTSQAQALPEPDATERTPFTPETNLLIESIEPDPYQPNRLTQFQQERRTLGTTGPIAFEPTEPGQYPVHLVHKGRIISLPQEDNTDALLCLDGLYVYQTIPAGKLLPEASLLELRARNAVVFYSQQQLFSSDPNANQLNDVIFGIYLEGDVVLQAGHHSITAEKLYYDFTQDKALVLDAVLSVQLPDRNLPLYARAATIRQLGLNRFAAEEVQISNDEFYEPGVWLGAAKAQFHLDPNAVATTQFEYDLENVSINVGSLPVFWLGRATGATAASAIPISRIHSSYSSDYGIGIESEWPLASILGIPEPPGLKSILRLDEFTKRGPAAGIDLDYRNEDRFGSMLTYLVHDEGQDDLGDFSALEEIEPTRHMRGRAKWQHRQYFPHSWQGTLELSYLSDPYFLESWYEKEFDTEKEQETLLYLKQQRDNWAFDFLAKWHLNDWDYTLTELPKAGLHLAAQDLFETFTYYHDGYVARIRERAGPRDVPSLSGLSEPSILPGLLDQDDFAFALSRHELIMPLQIGPIHLVPTLIGTYVFDDTASQQNFVQGAAGLRASTQFWHVDETAKSRMWDIDRIRHIVVPETSIFWIDSDKDDYEPRDVFNFTLRQRWQTMRGPKNAKYSVDFFRWNISTTLVDNDLDDTILPNKFFFSSPEPQLDKAPILNADLINLGLARREQFNQIFSDHVTTDWTWLISDTTTFTGGLNYNIHDGVINQTDTAISIQRPGRTNHYIGHTYGRNFNVFDNSDSHLLTAAANYRLNRKYTLAASHQFATDDATDSHSNVVIIRKFNHWYGAFSLGFDSSRDNLSFMVSFWPQGFDKIAIGSRRFTRLVR